MPLQSYNKEYNIFSPNWLTDWLLNYWIFSLKIFPKGINKNFLELIIQTIGLISVYNYIKNIKHYTNIFNIEYGFMAASGGPSSSPNSPTTPTTPSGIYMYINWIIFL